MLANINALPRKQPRPKRTVLWSSNPKIHKFFRGKLTSAFKARQDKLYGRVQTVNRKLGKHGRVSFTGNAALKTTQIWPQFS